MTIDLETHIEDVTRLLVFEDLHGVVLVGHSYGGMVITGVADREPERLARLVYLDAMVPRSGEAVLDIAGTDVVRTLRDWIAEEGHGTRLPAAVSGPEFYGITDPADIAWMTPRLTDQPAATYEQPLHLSRGKFPGPRTYVRCAASDKIPSEMAKRARNDPTFELRELQAGHDVMVTAPDLLIELLLDLAR
jgi:pimeloyl-ACP methyl ester carboxylesterase